MEALSRALVTTKSIPGPRPLKCSLQSMQSIAWMSWVQAHEPRGGCKPLIRQNKVKLGFGSLYGSKPAMSPAPAVIYGTSSNMKHLGRETSKVPSRKCMQQDGRQRPRIWTLPKSCINLFSVKKTNK